MVYKDYLEILLDLEQKCLINKNLSVLPDSEPIEIEQEYLHKQDTTSLEIVKENDHTYRVSGGYIENLARGIVFNDTASNGYFQYRLEKDGVMDKIRAKGAKNGDTICMGSLEFELVD